MLGGGVIMDSLYGELEGHVIIWLDVVVLCFGHTDSIVIALSKIIVSGIVILSKMKCQFRRI